MRLGDYYRGLPLRLATRLPPEEVARQINDAIPSPLRPFALGIVGRARLGRLHLRYRASFFTYDGMPMLTGPIEAHRSGSLLQLKYRGRLATRIAFPLSFLLIGCLALTFAIGGGWAPGIEAGEKALQAFVLVVVAILPLGIHMFAIRNAEAHFEKLADFLRTTLGARDAPS